MQKRAGFFIVFISFLFLSSALFFLFRTTTTPFVSSLFDTITSPIQRSLFSAFGGWLRIQNAEEMAEQNRILAKQLVDQKELLTETKALRDQYDRETIPAKKLLPAQVIGTRSFIPGVSLPEALILDKGSNQRVLIGQIVLQNDNVVGKITNVTATRALVTLISNTSQSVTAKALKTNALGILRGRGNGTLVFENVVLSDTLEKNDLVVTKGDQELNGTGYPPDVVVGRIISIDKKTSNLFQSAEVESFIDFSRVRRVFIVVGET